MKVLFVHSHRFRRIDGALYSSGGLAQEVLLRYVNWFGDLTVCARVISDQQVKSNYSKITDSHITVLDQKDAQLEKLVKEHDAVIVRLPSPNGYKAVSYARKHHKLYLVEVVGCIWDAYWNYSLKGKMVALPAMMIMKHSVKNAPYALYVSSEFLQRRYPTTGKSVSVSDVVLQHTDTLLLQQRLEKCANHSGRIVIGTAAAVNVPYKGQEYMIRALKLLEEKYPGRFEYQMAGGGDQSRLIGIAKECGVEDRVKFMGTLPHEKVFDWLDSIDLYIQPSLQEGLCRALVEAMSRGLPCMASKIGGNPELLDPEYIFSMRSRDKVPERIAAIVETLAAPDAMKLQAERNFRKAASEFEIDILEKRRSAFYLDFANEVKKCLK